MKETRNFNIDKTDTKKRVLEGMPIVFNEKALINDRNGSYYEMILPEALSETDLSDCHLLYNHDLNKIPLARTPKTMTVEKTPAGVRVRAELPETEEARSVYTAVERGDLTGMSFCFTVPEDGDSYDPETNTRTIHKINKIYEFSVVPIPAYSTTSVEARSKIDELNKEFDLKNKLKIKLNKILFKGI